MMKPTSQHASLMEVIVAKHVSIQNFVPNVFVTMIQVKSLTKALIVPSINPKYNQIGFWDLFEYVEHFVNMFVQIL